MKPQTKRTMPKRQSFCIALNLIFLLGLAASGDIQAEPRETGKSVEYNGFTLELPGGDWTRLDEHVATRITFMRNGKDQFYQCLGIWSEWVPLLQRGKSQQWYTSAYFDKEKYLSRSQDCWGGFVEGERFIAGRRYPTMSFHISHSSGQAEEFFANGLFLLIFPQDFEVRHSFHVLMWLDSYLAHVKGKGLEELDEIVSSFQPLKEE